MFLAVALAAFLASFLEFRTELIDDAYISLRYARHLAAGHGLVWNPGEPVEGYTDFLWVLLLSLVNPTPAGAWGLGLLTGALLLLVAARPPGSLRLAGPAGALLPVTLAANLAVPFWAAKGLETPLYSLLLTAGLFLYAASRDAEPADPSAGRRAVLGIHILALSALARPEGLLFLVLAVADRALRSRGRDRSALLLPVLLLAPHFAFRLAYYGYPLPNTFYAKVGFAPEQFLRGLDYLWRFFAHPQSLLFVAALPAGLRGTPAHRFLAAALLAGLAGIVYVGGDAFGAFRFLVPLLPALHLLALAGAASVASRVGARAPQAGGLVGPAAALLLAALAFAESRGPVLAEEREVVRFTSLMVQVGRVLKERTPPWVTIALNPTGAVPYYSERRAIDMLGLNDVHIAHQREETMGLQKAGHEKGDGAYVLSRRPDLILIGNVWVDDKIEVTKLFPSRKSEVQISKLPETYEKYELVYFALPDGDLKLKALALRDKTRLPESGWGPTSFTPIPKAKWE